jgi:hypothetical protein
MQRVMLEISAPRISWSDNICELLRTNVRNHLFNRSGLEAHPEMKITLEMSGGFAYFPKLNRPIVTDTEQIESRIAKQLASLVRESHFFDQPARADTAAKGAADYRTYTITVQDGPRVHSVQFTDPITNAYLERLVSRLQAMAHPSTP